jgi:hypothetical protein
MDAIILAVIIFVAIAGPTLLALALYWRNNPDRRLSWRRAAENAADTDPGALPASKCAVAVLRGWRRQQRQRRRRRRRRRRRFQPIASSTDARSGTRSMPAFRSVVSVLVRFVWSRVMLDRGVSADA